MTTFLGVKGRTKGLASINESIVDQALNSVDTYVDGSSIQIDGVFQARTSIRFRLWLTKTAAGVATPTFDVRVGAAGTIADTSRLQFTGPAQTAAADTAYIEILVLLRNEGASGVLSGVLRMAHNLASTGFSVVGTPIISGVSSAFDTEPKNSHIGLSINPGASGVWTVKSIIADLVNT